MVFVEGVKFSCQPCIKGHRSANCVHPDRPLFEVKKKGRPKTQCLRCQKRRETTGGHGRCDCPKTDEPQQLVLPYGVPRDGLLTQFRATLARNDSVSSNVSSAASSASAGSRSRANSDAKAANESRRQSVSSSVRRKESTASSNKPHDLAHGHSLHSHLSHTFSPYPSHSPHSRSAPMTRSPSVGSSSHTNEVIVNVVPPPPTLNDPIAPPPLSGDFKPQVPTFALPPIAGYAAAAPPMSAESPGSQQQQQQQHLYEPAAEVPLQSAIVPKLERSASTNWSTASSEAEYGWVPSPSNGVVAPVDAQPGHSPVEPAQQQYHDQQHQELHQTSPPAHSMNNQLGGEPSNPFDALASMNLTAEIDKWRQDFEFGSFDVDGTGPSGWTSGYDDEGDDAVVFGGQQRHSPAQPTPTMTVGASSGSESGADFELPPFDVAPPPVLNAYDYPRSMWPWLDDAFLSSSSSSSRAASSIAESDYSDYAASVDNLPSLIDAQQYQNGSINELSPHGHQQQQQQSTATTTTTTTGLQQSQIDPAAAALESSLAEFDLSLDRTDTLVAPKPGQVWNQPNQDGYDEDDEYDSDDLDDGDAAFPRMDGATTKRRKKKKSVVKRFFSNFT
ncbi:copper-binding transcription factor [Microbotryomycetes sp. JL221]|nr:copper-binding transcription factor [Microbotryomycetes sp. JL221]